MRMAKQLLRSEKRDHCSICGGDHRHLCTRCQNKAQETRSEGDQAASKTRLPRMVQPSLSAAAPETREEPGDDSGADASHRDLGH